MTQDGEFFGSVDKTGKVQFMNHDGSIIWTKQVEGATDMMIAKNGQSVLVYSKLNPIYQDVYFFRADGFRLWNHRVEGSIWAGAVSSNGSYAAVTTGKQFVYVYRPDPNHPKYHRWRLDGIGRSIAFSPDSEHIIIGAWQKSGLLRFDLNGKLEWRGAQRTERQYNVRISADERTILSTYPGRQHDPYVEFSLWDSRGKLLWRKGINGYDGWALVSPTSQYVALSYANTISHGDSRIIERKVDVYKADGQLLWRKGGLFFGPRLIALSPKGSSVIVWDGEKSLYNIDQNGRILSKLILGNKVSKVLSSEDGRKVLLYCSDGFVYLLNIG